MKYSWLPLLLTGLSCHEPEKAPPLDEASRLAGDYDLVYSYIGNNFDPYVKLTGSLQLVRLDAKTVKPTFKISGFADGLIEKGTWQLTKITEDSVLCSASGYSCGVKNGLVDMKGYADGTIFFRFKKKD
ncbi:hypothetical protein ACAW74_23210 [Fibrella sp. WM1]|uniref:hypothetical protein n=1 Tax=Fibrella musci TaxID=3242485 RepID=UPI0035214562